MPVRMELSRILIRELNDFQIIELREVAATQTEDGGEAFSQVENGRSFPIVIGLPEAQAIERRLKGVPSKRPQTHDLLVSIIEQLGGKTQAILINDLSEHTFFAVIEIKSKDGKVVKIDARPSDAIAIGIANNVPIFVAEHVLDAAQNEEP